MYSHNEIPFSTPYQSGTLPKIYVAVFTGIGISIVSPGVGVLVSTIPRGVIFHRKGDLASPIAGFVFSPVDACFVFTGIGVFINAAPS